MFQLKDNVSLAIIGLLLLGIMMVAVKLQVTMTALKTTQAKLMTAELSVSVLQTDLSGVTGQLDASEQENTRLRLDVERTASLLSNREQSRQQVDQEAAAITAQTKQIIGAANDENVIHWANTDVPDELNRLLKFNADCAHRDRQANAVCIAATGIDELLPNTELFREN